MDSESRRGDVSFDDGEVRLAGTLALPVGPGPHPGVVMVGGSGPSDRDNDVLFPPIREHLVQAGLAVLSYDKRGVGGSSGSWLGSGIAELAGDALTALDFLRARPEVAAESVGLFGHSEGGWVVLRAAAEAGAEPAGTTAAAHAAEQAGGPAWVVTNSGPGVGPERQERFALATAARAAGASEADVDACLELFDRIVAAARRDAGFAEVDALTREHPAHALFGTFGAELDEPMWLLWKRYVDHDPAPDVARLRCPHLAVFGAADPIVPVVDSVTAFTTAARRSNDGRNGLTVEVFAGADHRLRDGHGHGHGHRENNGFAPGYLATLSRWILANG